MAFRSVATPEPMARIAAGTHTGAGAGLLGVSTAGALFAWSPIDGSARRLAGDLDAASPLAIGHGRIAARRRDGALWVLEGGRPFVSNEGLLAPAAGLPVLPLAVIAVEAGAKAHRVARLEPSGSGSWATVARSDVTVMPDARPLQADLGGSGDAGHMVVLAGPTARATRMVCWATPSRRSGWCFSNATDRA